MKKAVSININQCTGCGACSNSCPRGAIAIKKDLEGFNRYSINSDICNNCGVCAKKCPVENTRYTNEKEPECYAVWASDEIRSLSSSGGMFSILADKIISQHGYVCGVIHNKDFSAQHIISNKPQDIALMRGSKYVQSNTNNVYKKIGELLRNKKKVLFTGMPCQVAGLYGFLGKEDENLFTVELVCHGITSYTVLERYQKNVFEDKELISLEYKKKTPWGWHAGINAEFSDGTSYRVPAEEDTFFQAYLNGFSKDSACSECKFNCIPRQADMTIGDFWKISEFDNSLNDGRGTSLVLINNAHGNELMNSVKEQLVRCVKVPLKYAIAGNVSLQAPYKRHMRRTKFFRELNIIDYKKLVQHCKQNHFDVGIVGLWYGLNYGSILTYYALYCVIEKMGYDALMVNKPDFIWRPLYCEPQTIANQFILKHCSVSSLHTYVEFPLLNRHCDTFMVGSDVVWNYEICGKEAGNFFYLDFVDNTKKKIAYAASFGGGYNAPKEDQYMNQYYLQHFDAVSVREDMAVNICKDYFGVEAEKVLDPVFLCDFKEFENIANEAELILNEEYIMTYILGGNKEQKELILWIAQILNCSCLINVPNPNNPVRVAEALNLEMINPQPSVEEWLWYMKNTHFFIGDSFHGLCFAILFRKDFMITISRNMPSKDRFLVLLNICGLQDRVLYIEDDNTDKRYILERKIDYDRVFQKLEKYQINSYMWLQKSLKVPKSKVTNIIEECSDELYFVAKAAYENCHGRKIITWGNSPEFNGILQKYFGITVIFWVARNHNLVDNISVFDFDILRGKKMDYYLVIPDNLYKEEDAKLIETFGYEDIKDYIYRKHKPITILSGNYTNKKYFDAYGNSIQGKIPDRFQIIFSGFNNILQFGKQVRALSIVKANLTGNTELKIGDGSVFSEEFDINFVGINGKSSLSKVKIGRECKFSQGKIRIWKFSLNKKKSTCLFINDRSTFNSGLSININSGRRVIIGEDCMFSFNICFQIGDGHAIFDVNTKKRININDQDDYTQKEQAIIGEHVWVGRNVMVLENTFIGAGSIIGAGSVVKGNFLNNCTVAGNPAKKIKQDIAWSRDNGTSELSEKENRYMNLTIETNLLSGKKCLVLGGTRFMGIRLVEKLLERGWDVTIATRGNRKDTFGTRVKRLKIDRNNEASIRNKLEGTQYDVIFDNTAYTGAAVKNLMKVVVCCHYIQVSSIAVYRNHHLNMTEDEMDVLKEKNVPIDEATNYGLGKRNAEYMALHKFENIPVSIVRIPFVVEPGNLNCEFNRRLFFYVEHIMKKKPIKVDNDGGLDYNCSFIRTNEEAEFLIYLAEHRKAGVYNFSSQGSASVGEIIQYIERKSKIKAIISQKGDKSPFNKEHFGNIGNGFSLDLSRTINTGFSISKLNEWLFPLLDSYIAMFHTEDTADF